MTKTIRPLLVVFAALTLVTGVAYPLAVTAVGQAAFPHQAHGSLIVRDGKPLGSALIGQNFSYPGYFWGRPSATAEFPNNATASGGSNQGPLNPALIDAAKSRLEALRAADPTNTAPVPVELVTASASGLDPHISLAAAQYQLARVAAARKLTSETMQTLVAQHTEHPLLGVLGEPVVNVLQLNMALDAHSANGKPY